MKLEGLERLAGFTWIFEQQQQKKCQEKGLNKVNVYFLRHTGICIIFNGSFSLQTSHICFCSFGGTVVFQKLLYKLFQIKVTPKLINANGNLKEIYSNPDFRKIRSKKVRTLQFLSDVPIIHIFCSEELSFLEFMQGPLTTLPLAQTVTLRH